MGMFDQSLFNTNPALAQALLTGGVALMQPIQPGQTASGAIGNAAVAGLSAYQAGTLLQGKLQDLKDKREKDKMQRQLVDYALGQFNGVPAGIAAPMPGNMPEGLSPQQAMGAAAAYGGDYGPAVSAFKSPDAPKPYTLNPGDTRFSGANQPVASLPAAGKVPTTRSRISGTDTIVEQYNPQTMKWDEVSRGPRAAMTGESATMAPIKRDAINDANSAAGAMAQVSGMIQNLNDLGPGIVGLRGLTSEKVGGLLGQINSNLGSNFSEWVSNASPEEVQKFRTDSALLIGKMTGPILNDDGSGRVSNMQRQIAAEAMRLASPGASIDQVRAALNSSLKLQVLISDQSNIVAGNPPNLDLTKREDVNKLGEKLMGMGMSPADALETIKLMTAQRENLKGLF